jgi:hypothetical protein
MDWHRRNLYFETLKHEVPKCETFIISMFSGIYDHACYAPKKKHEDGCM